MSDKFEEYANDKMRLLRLITNNGCASDEQKLRTVLLLMKAYNHTLFKTLVSDVYGAKAKPWLDENLPNLLKEYEITIPMKVKVRAKTPGSPSIGGGTDFRIVGSIRDAAKAAAHSHFDIIDVNIDGYNVEPAKR